ncbi:MAG: acyl-CoA dehydrogenase family protein [Deltaproteobacteria bacterium]|nr:acyl-CoA dehydrogenase family protein [Deltaproteobacteria bacterium]MDP2968813.1 acyl-CoA dehydrogenase family protein [Deltaproteobacteria bacterium]
MDFTLSLKQKQIRQMVREFAKAELAPIAREIDEEGRFPWEAVEKMGPLNFFGMQAPRQYRGAEIDSISYCLVIEEISRICAAMGLTIAVHNSVVVYPLSQFGSDEQKAKYLPPLAGGEKIGAFCLTEPNAGSDAMAIESTAIGDGDSYIINANKIFVTNGGVADTLIIFTSVHPGDVKRGFSAILVERGTPGFEVGLLENNCGMRANPVSSIVLADCRVPRANLLGQEGDGFKIAMTALDTGRIGIAAQAVGIGQGALDASLKYAKERIQFRVPLARHQAIQMMLADMGTMVEAARLLTFQAAYVKDQKGELSCASAMAKLYAGRMASKVASMGVQIHGGYGYSKDYPIERYFRDARATEIYEGTSEIQQMVIARELLKRGEG